jgi:urea transporter
MLIGLVAILLPGVGQVLNQQPQRGLTFLFFLLLGGWISYHLTTPEHSMIGRLAGRVFVYAMSILDAYKWARVRNEQAAHERRREHR